MPPALAQVLLSAVMAYLGVGLLFAVPFAWSWSGRLDRVAAEGSLGFRLLILPGAMLLWPILAYRLLTGAPR